MVRCGCGVKGVNTATHREYIVQLSAKILNPEAVVMFRGRVVEIQDADAGVPLARAAIEAAQIQAGMQDDLEALEAARSAAAAGGWRLLQLWICQRMNSSDVTRNTSMSKRACTWNEQAGMRMDDAV